ncbi:MAG: hypothetical protein IPL61_18045 [Myxococcales bacterium]|nr:hypothetical protein [Myxococcales bacterium]
MDLTALDLEALLAAAQREVDDDAPDATSPHLVELHRRGARAIFERAVAVCASAAADERVLGVWILRELRSAPPRLAAEAVAVLLALARREPEPEVQHRRNAI